MPRGSRMPGQPGSGASRKCAHQCAMGRVLKVKCEALAKCCGHLQLQPGHLTVSVMLRLPESGAPATARCRDGAQASAHNAHIAAGGQANLIKVTMKLRRSSYALKRSTQVLKSPAHCLVVLHTGWACQLVSAGYCAAWRSLRQRLPHRNTHSCGNCAACKPRSTCTDL